MWNAKDPVALLHTFVLSWETIGTGGNPVTNLCLAYSLFIQLFICQDSPSTRAPRHCVSLPIGFSPLRFISLLSSLRCPQSTKTAQLGQEIP